MGTSLLGRVDLRTLLSSTVKISHRLVPVRPKELMDAASGYRPSEIIALAKFTSFGSEKFQDVGIFDALGHGGQIQVMCEPQNRVDNFRAVGILLHDLDEGTIDFDFVKFQLPEVKKT